MCIRLLLGLHAPCMLGGGSSDNLILERSRKSTIQIVPSQLAHISSQLIELSSGVMPNKFARQPRSLELLDRWKATEFKQFLLYPGPVVLKNILTESKYKHFFSLSIAYVYSFGK